MTVAPAPGLPPVPSGAEAALVELLLAMADDEAVIGWTDSEWTGIAPLLEEDVAMSSLAQDELGHAQALYVLLAGLTGTDPDVIAYDRVPADHRHARLLDHGRGDWALTIARRWLYETADAVRLEALAGCAWTPLRELVAKLQREERYHRLHIDAWLDRLAGTAGAPRDRLVDAFDALAPDAATVFAPLPGEERLIAAGIMDPSLVDQERRWRAVVEPRLQALDLAAPPPARAPERGRLDHGEAFRWLHGEMTTVRASDPGASW